ncbi:uncharacterized protein B0H64DRAFT_385211 [Chaetomium fimeti]|uniref:Uncharacterized protein n=1 Tax=Chaetomium fimeti TaxID=1854472 RepID=A0AAE0HL26_9PEZI|nr:hypothetical protein B0H64DRAFT_385211 [Chaetomium fimeti]
MDTRVFVFLLGVFVRVSFGLGLGWLRSGFIVTTPHRPVVLFICISLLGCHEVHGRGWRGKRGSRSVLLGVSVIDAIAITSMIMKDGVRLGLVWSGSWVRIRGGGS